MYRLQSKVDSASFVQFDVHRTVLYVLYSTAVLVSVYRVYSVYSSTQETGLRCPVRSVNAVVKETRVV